MLHFFINNCDSMGHANFALASSIIKIWGNKNKLPRMYAVCHNVYSRQLLSVFLSDPREKILK